MIEIGIRDEEFIRGDVPMTKQEIRILALAKARIHSRDVVYDIGAGTGSISIEAARLTPDGAVFALERNPKAIELIYQNADKFGVDNLTVMETEAPEGMEHLPMANVIFIGGSGGDMVEILRAADLGLVPGGRIVITCITIQTLMACIFYMRENSDFYDYETIQIQATRLEQIGDYDMAKAMNPVFIMTCQKKEC